MRVRVLITITGARPAGECTCDRATTENQKVEGETCGCGLRAKSMFASTIFFICCLNIIRLGFFSGRALWRLMVRIDELTVMQMPAAARRHPMAASCLRRRISLLRLLGLRLGLRRGRGGRKSWHVSLWA